MDYGSAEIRNVISTAIDSLDNDGKLHIGTILASGAYGCLAQKISYSDYASGLVFGYSNDKLFYQIKRNGSWFIARQI
jgi:hypothetical protein